LHLECRSLRYQTTEYRARVRGILPDPQGSTDSTISGLYSDSKDVYMQGKYIVQASKKMCVDAAGDDISIATSALVS